MLTIRAMVRVGPWTILGVEWIPEWTSCQRCGERIKEVWVCEVDPVSERFEELRGQAIWRIGSDCGPKLLAVSDAVWKMARSPIQRRFRLLGRAERLIAVASVRGYELPPVVAQRLQGLADGTATDKEMRHLGLVIGTHAKKLRLP